MKERPSQLHRPDAELSRNAVAGDRRLAGLPAALSVSNHPSGLVALGRADVGDVDDIVSCEQDCETDIRREGFGREFDITFLYYTIRNDNIN